jgi:hypothetical protein
VIVPSGKTAAAVKSGACLATSTLMVNISNQLLNRVDYLKDGCQGIRLIMISEIDLLKL